VTSCVFFGVCCGVEEDRRVEMERVVGQDSGVRKWKGRGGGWEGMLKFGWSLEVMNKQTMRGTVWDW
jgi:hypothetical protein